MAHVAAEGGHAVLAGFVERDGRRAVPLVGHRALHEEMGCIVRENPRMGLYFITDPDGQWIEILPA